MFFIWLKSLFFPPALLNFGENPAPEIDLNKLSELELWELLKSIDPVRAKQIHQNGLYRIRRALDIWIQTGQKPSIYKPIYSPIFNAMIIYVCPPTDILNQRIKQRTEQMVHCGWIDEAKALMGTDWQEFVEFKGFIGYSEIFEYLKNNKEASFLPDLINKIQIKTMQYAKRQRTFWRSFANQIDQKLDKKCNFIKILEIFVCDDDALYRIINEFSNMK